MEQLPNLLLPLWLKSVQNVKTSMKKFQNHKKLIIEKEAPSNLTNSSYQIKRNWLIQLYLYSSQTMLPQQLAPFSLAHFILVHHIFSLVPSHHGLRNSYFQTVDPRSTSSHQTSFVMFGRLGTFACIFYTLTKSSINHPNLIVEMPRSNLLRSREF